MPPTVARVSRTCGAFPFRCEGSAKPFMPSSWCAWPSSCIAWTATYLVTRVSRRARTTGIRESNVHSQECPGGKQEQHAGPPLPVRPIKLRPAQHCDEQPGRNGTERGCEAEDEQMAPGSAFR